MDIIDFKRDLLEQLYKPYQTLASFSLPTQGATKVVLGHGNPNASLMIIGEAPGQQEDQQGLPFVGRSGALINKALEANGIQRKDIFITNVVKCRPLNNRTPTPEEITYYTNILLLSEIKIVRPEVILLLGAVALEALLQKKGISKVRGTVFDYQESKIVPTYHPAYILRNPAAFAFFCDDFKKAFSLIK